MLAEIFCYDWDNCVRRSLLSRNEAVSKLRWLANARAEHAALLIGVQEACSEYPCSRICKVMWKVFAMTPVFNATGVWKHTKESSEAGTVYREFCQCSMRARHMVNKNEECAVKSFIGNSSGAVADPHFGAMQAAFKVMTASRCLWSRRFKHTCQRKMLWDVLLLPIASKVRNMNFLKGLPAKSYTTIPCNRIKWR